MARGRQPSPSQLMEELRMEIQAVAMDLVVHDRWEMYALREVRRIAQEARQSIIDGRPARAVTMLAQLEAITREHQARDVRENHEHRHMATVARDGVA